MFAKAETVNFGDSDVADSTRFGLQSIAPPAEKDKLFDCSDIEVYDENKVYRYYRWVQHKGRVFYKHEYFSAPGVPGQYHTVYRGWRVIYWTLLGQCEREPTPTADFIFATHQLEVDFMDRSLDDEGVNTMMYHWNFGDGNTSTERHPTHKYSLAGEYTVSLTVTDNSGLQDTKTASLTCLTEGGCQGAKAWRNEAIYQQDDEVLYQGYKFKARFWTQYQNPEQNSGWQDAWAQRGYIY